MSWTAADHACRFCLGRVLVQDGEFWCPTCGARGDRVPAICGCGVVVADSGRQLLRCMANPRPTPAFPALMVISRPDPPF